MRRAAFAVLSTIAGLVGLLSFKTEATGSTATAASSAVAATGQTTTTSGTNGTTSGASSARSSSSGSYTGSVVETQYGPVQVRITVTNGKVTNATAVQYPNTDPRSAQINAHAVPALQQESVGATSVNSVQMVSGATYTSEGYLQSLQSALNKAGL